MHGETLKNHNRVVPNIEGILGGGSFKDDEEVKDAVQQCLKALTAEVYDEGMQITS